MRKRKHRNTSRLTANERVEAIRLEFDAICAAPEFWKAIEYAIQAAVRQALARHTRRLNERLGATGDIAPLARKKARST